MSDGGKGSAQRPRQISEDEWANRWDAIFSRDLKEQDEPELQDAEKPTTGTQ